MDEAAKLVPELEHTEDINEIVTIQEQNREMGAVYEQSDVFLWANNLFQVKEQLKIEVFLFNKNNVVYRTRVNKELDKQLQPLFIDGLLEYVLTGAGEGLVVRGFEEAESEENVLQRLQVAQVEQAKELLRWLTHQENEIELFTEEEYDFKRVRGLLVRCSHASMERPFYIMKLLPQAQIMKQAEGTWMFRGANFTEFDAGAALRIPADNQLLIIDDDMYVFNQAKLEQLFGYNAKKNSIAEKKIAEIETNFSLSFADGMDLQTMVKGKKSTINKLQKIEPSKLKQDDILSHAEEMGIELMTDTDGSIIIMSEGDLNKFVNLLNDDYVESGLTGERYEILRKKALKPTEESS
ncbi:MAG: hypothetical protein JWL85_277 [Candidatus Saccharibacteria bacterium]|nr:hypothetical protein [Candidatus Saccharibacteria bacterium]